MTGTNYRAQGTHPDELYLKTLAWWELLHLQTKLLVSTGSNIQELIRIKLEISVKPSVGDFFT